MKTQGLVLNIETKLAALLLAEKTFERNRNRFGHYRNTANGHLIGRLGEFASFIWLKENGFEPEAAFTDSMQNQQCDIASKVGRIEVKSWNEKHWDDWGRCVSVSQYASIKKKADLIFWCSVDDFESDTPRVTFRGWCKVDIFEGMAPILTGKEGRQINNYQLAEDQLSSLDSLKELL